MAGFDRKFEVWTFNDPETMPEPVQLEVRYKGPENKAEGAILYYVASGIPPVRAEDATFEGLRTKVLEALREWFRISWEPRVCVAVSTRETQGYGREKQERYAPRVDVFTFDQGIGENDRAVYWRGEGRREGRAVYAGDFQPDRFGSTDLKWVTLADTAEVRSAIKKLEEDLDETVGRLLAGFLALGDYRDASVSAAVAAEEAAR